MYKIIRQHPTTLAIYSKKLVEQGVITEEEIDAAKAEWRARLDEEFDSVQGFKPNKADWLERALVRAEGGEGGTATIRVGAPTRHRDGDAGGYRSQDHHGARGLQRPPHHPPFRRQSPQDDRIPARVSNWATAEALAFGSLVREGHRVRLSGQDVERGTFSQRHSVLLDQESPNSATPRSTMFSEGQAHYEVINSMLSGRGRAGLRIRLLGSRSPMRWCSWEAQFGDFANGAQVVFDQFISSGERKWLRMSGLVCLLPHGYEGQGSGAFLRPPGALSCRCARKTTCRSPIASTPANYFHILRRQLKRDFRKPLILMTPKSFPAPQALRPQRCW